MGRTITIVMVVCFLISFATLPVCPATALAASEEESTDKGVTQEDQTGTDPRGFAPKFMPYYRYVKLKNDLEVQVCNRTFLAGLQLGLPDPCLQDHSGARPNKGS